MSSQTIKNA
ncbi:hypothetical protein VCHENC02_2702A, partial [Vibrio harveyi]